MVEKIEDSKANLQSLNEADLSSLETGKVS